MLKRPSLNSVRSESDDKFHRISHIEEGNVIKNIAEKHYSILSVFNRCLLFSSVCYLLVIASISYAVDKYGPVQKSYFSNKHNVFNQYFVKLGWAWTFTLLCLFVGLASYIRSGGNTKSVFKNWLRMMAGTAGWYISVSIFDHFHGTSGFCSEAFTWDISTCKSEHVRRIDISGHTFLLLFCILIILEESRLFEQWSLVKKKTSSRNLKIRRLHSQYSVFVYLLVILVVLLFVLWHVMLLSTLLYFHDTLQKVLGALFAVTSWLLLYKVIFKFCSVSPGADNQIF